MSTDQINDFLLGGGGASASFEAVGDTVTGTIVSAEIMQQTDILDNKPLTWDDGSPKLQLVVRLKTAQRDPDNPDDDGTRAVYVKGSKKAGTRSLHDAVASAVRAAGAKSLETGGTLAVTFAGTEPSATKGFNPRKLYTATYAPPDRAAQAGSFLGTTTPTPAAPAPTEQAPVAAPAPAAVPLPVGLTPEQAELIKAWQTSHAQQPA